MDRQLYYRLSDRYMLRWPVMWREKRAGIFGAAFLSPLLIHFMIFLFYLNAEHSLTPLYITIALGVLLYIVYVLWHRTTPREHFAAMTDSVKQRVLIYDSLWSTLWRTAYGFYFATILYWTMVELGRQRGHPTLSVLLLSTSVLVLIGAFFLRRDLATLLIDGFRKHPRAARLVGLYLGICGAVQLVGGLGHMLVVTQGESVAEQLEVPFLILLTWFASGILIFSIAGALVTMSHFVTWRSFDR